MVIFYSLPWTLIHKANGITKEGKPTVVPSKQFFGTIAETDSTPEITQDQRKGMNPLCLVAAYGLKYFIPVSVLVQETSEVRG